jgi:pilus assembly protein TadC
MPLLYLLLTTACLFTALAGALLAAFRPRPGRWAHQVIALHQRPTAGAAQGRNALLHQVLSLLTPYIAELSPDHLSNLDRRLERANHPFGIRSAIQLFLIRSILAATFLTINVIPFLQAPTLPGGLKTILFPLVWFTLPNIVIKAILEARERRIMREFPMMLDMLRINLQVGLTLPQSLKMAVTVLEGPLRDEVARLSALLEIEPNPREAFAIFHDRVGAHVIEVSLDSLLLQSEAGTETAAVAELMSRQAALARDLSRADQMAAARRRGLYSNLLPIGIGLMLLLLQGFPLVMRFLEAMQRM